MKLELEKEDWIQLAKYLHVAHEVRSLVESKILEGKQQVTVQDEAIRRWLEHDIPPTLWFTLGAVVRENTEESE